MEEQQPALKSKSKADEAYIILKIKSYINKSNKFKLKAVKLCKDVNRLIKYLDHNQQELKIWSACFNMDSRWRVRVQLQSEKPKPMADVKHNLRVEQEHDDAHEFSTTADVSGLSEAEQAHFDDGGGTTGLLIVISNALHIKNIALNPDRVW